MIKNTEAPTGLEPGNTLILGRDASQYAGAQKNKALKHKIVITGKNEFIHLPELSSITSSRALYSLATFK